MQTYRLTYGPASSWGTGGRATNAPVTVLSHASRPISNAELGAQIGGAVSMSNAAENKTAPCPCRWAAAPCPCRHSHSRHSESDSAVPPVKSSAGQAGVKAAVRPMVKSAVKPTAKPAVKPAVKSTVEPTTPTTAELTVNSTAVPSESPGGLLSTAIFSPKEKAAADLKLVFQKASKAAKQTTSSLTRVPKGGTSGHCAARMLNPHARWGINTTQCQLNCKNWVNISGVVLWVETCLA